MKGTVYKDDPRTVLELKEFNADFTRIIPPIKLTHVPAKIMEAISNICYNLSKQKTKLRGFSPQANYIDRATAACRRS
jgi:hypothetical protein